MMGSTLSDKPTNSDGNQNAIENDNSSQGSGTLGPEDVFEVKVFEQESLCGDHRVSSSGTIIFPLVGEINVMHKTANEVAVMISESLAKYIKNPYVSVYIKEFKSKKIFVFGQVQKPGTYRFEDKMSIIQAITVAGGFTERAAGNKTSVTRNVGGKELKLMVSVEEIAEGKTKNFFLVPGDIIFVPQAYF